MSIRDYRMTKISAMPNPALFVDDAIDAYVMYNANKKQATKQPIEKAPIEKAASVTNKQAGFYDGITSAAENLTYKILNDPKY